MTTKPDITIQEHNDRLDEALGAIQRLCQVKELARVERLTIIRAMVDAALPDKK
jgi:hypothetical protein